jgi:hypothetical protein
MEVSVSRFLDHGESMLALMSTEVRDRAPALFKCGIAVVAAMLIAAPAPVLAAAEVSGTPQAVRIEAQNTSVADILAALGRDFGVKYTSSADLDRPITGTYEGSLQRVLARVLDGYDFVVKMRDGRVDLTVLGTGGGPAAAVAAATPAPTPSAPKAAPVAAATAAPPLKAESPAPAIKTAEHRQVSAPDAPPSATAPVPEVKLAEGPVAVPMLAPSSVAPPIPTGPGPVPEMQPLTAAPPVPTIVGSTLLDAPQPAQGPAPAPANGTGATPPAGMVR